MDTVALTIGKKTDGGYPISLAEFDDVAGKLSDPFKEDVLAPLADGRLIEIREMVLTQDQPSDAIPDTGVELHDWLVGTDTGQEWASRDQAVGLRTVLTIDDPELRTVPWELMCGPGLPSFARATNPVVRGSLNLDTRLPEPIEWPLRVLIVVGENTATQDESIFLNSEITAVQRVFLEYRRMVEPVILWCPNSSHFNEVLDSLKPHVIHFIGHGSEDPGSGQTVLSIDADVPWDWDIGTITAQFHYQSGNWQPRFVLLNACRSSVANRLEQQGHAWSVAQAFFDAGVPAVLGMQADIRGDDAAMFSAPFYRELLGGQCIDKCLCGARNAAVSRDRRRRDWCLPHLEVNGNPEHVLPMSPIDSNRRQYVSNIPEFQQHTRFVDREQFRGKLRNQIAPFNGVQSRKVTVIKGRPDIGKSALLHYFLEGCLYRNWFVAFADQKKGEYTNFLETLEQLAKGTPYVASELSPNHIQNSPAAFTDYVTATEEFRKLVDVDQTNSLSAWTPQSLTAAHNVVVEFANAISRVAVAENRTFLLAIDHLKVVEDQYSQLLLPQLFRINRGEVKNVCAILVVEAGAEFDYAPATLIQSDETIDVLGFARDDFERCVREFFVRNENLTDNAKFAEVIKLRCDSLDEEWEPNEFAHMEMVVDYLLGGR